MALVFPDSVWFNATSTGLGDFVVASALASYRTPAGASVANGATLHYSARTATEFENGEGIYTSGTVTLARTTIYASSNSNAKVNFGSIPTVSIAPLGEDLALYQLLDATLTALAAFNTNGLLVQTAADTFAGRTVTGTASRIAVTNGNGVGGNPTIDIDSAYVGQSTITTLGTITTGTWNGTDIAFANIAQGTARSVLGVTGNATADLASIQSGAAGQVLNSTATAISWTATPTITTSLTTPLLIGGTAASSALTLESTSGVGTSDTIIFKTGSQVERLRIATDGEVHIGFVAGATALFSIRDSANTNTGSNVTFDDYVSGTANNRNVYQRIINYNADAFGDGIAIYYARGNATTPVIVNSSDAIGAYGFGAWDGAGFRDAASIRCEIDSAPGANSMPARLKFQTTPSGSTTPAERVRIDSAGIMWSLGGFGFGPAGVGAGGAVTQGTSRTTGVTLNTVSGAITIFSAAGVTTGTSFTLTNNKIAASDVIVFSQKSGTNLYEVFATTVSSGSCVVSFRTTGGTATDAPVFNFVIIKGNIT